MYEEKNGGKERIRTKAVMRGVYGITVLFAKTDKGFFFFLVAYFSSLKKHKLSYCSSALLASPVSVATTHFQVP